MGWEAYLGYFALRASVILIYCRLPLAITSDIILASSGGRLACLKSDVGRDPACQSMRSILL
jgi:hypothetical protein